MAEKEYYTVGEVADLLLIKQETVRRWLRAKKLDGVSLGERSAWRIPASEIARLKREGPARP